MELLAPQILNPAIRWKYTQLWVLGTYMYFLK